MIGKLKSDVGYTLTEVLVVLTIVGLLAGLAFPAMNSAVQRAREATLRSNLQTIRGVIDDYYADHNVYPSNLEVLVEQGYLRHMPVDTITREPQDWQIVEANEETGVFSIKSRSTEIATDGSIYADW